MLTLQNTQSGQLTVDHLSQNAVGRCPAHACLGSVINTNKEVPTVRSMSDVKSQAKEFIGKYYASLKESDSENHVGRWENVETQINNTGTYDLTFDELLFGAKLAWRNVSRCIGRMHWNSLKVFDMRHITTTDEMFTAICNHMIYATKGGQIKIAITMFPSRKPGKGDFRIWNSQIIAYAGYLNSDGSITGDPNTVKFTDMCIKMGWTGHKTNFDILPILLSANGEDPVMYELPEECILRIPITHPKYPKLNDLKLEWYASPAISNMIFDCGGVEFPASPFNGWYIGTEIGARNFTDTYRYNMLEKIAEKVGLNTRNPTSLWKDQALVEINYAILYSYQKKGVTIMDHHTASENFMRYFDKENKVRGGCPADWVWLVPPMSGSVTPLYHQEMALYYLKPNYEYQEPAWETHKWKNPQYQSILSAKENNIDKMKALERKMSNRKKRVKVTIIYATESGKSAVYAEKIGKVFDKRFNAHVYAMDEYDFSQIEEEKLIIVVASTFGNGDPPSNGVVFFQNLLALKEKQAVNLSSTFFSGKTSFSVFALGNSSYSDFCGFGRNVDKVFGELGAERLLEMTCGNELDGQWESFQSWGVDIFTTACQKFGLLCDDGLLQSVNKLLNIRTSNMIVRARKASVSMKNSADVLSKLHNRDVATYQLVDRKVLYEGEDDHITLQVILKNISNDDAFSYEAGDHFGIFPENQEDDCTFIYKRLVNKPKKGQAIQVEYKYEESDEDWKITDKLPQCTLFELLTTYLDISTPCSQKLLHYFESCTTDNKEKAILSVLAQDKKEYENWKKYYSPTLACTLKQFPNVEPDAVSLISKLPSLQPRYYSVSSSPLQHPDEIHLTLAVLRYPTKNGTGPMNLGVCSNFLNDTPTGAHVSAFLRSSPFFHLPKELNVPVILIGAGTGISPFRGFWQDRQILKNLKDVKQGKMSMYIGCRNADSILYKNELLDVVDNDENTKVYVAMSRQPSKKKTYVQDLLIHNGEEIVKQIVNEGAHIFICGKCSVADDAISTIKNLVARSNRKTENEAENIIETLKSQGRYHVDVFGSSYQQKSDDIFVNYKSELFAFLDQNM